MVDMIPVESSRITDMGYDAETATVHVQFTDGVGWCYYNVPEDVWEAFMAAPSKGRFINDVLDHYPHGPA